MWARPLHGEHGMLACAAGTYVLTEKPVSTSLDGAQAMVSAAERGAGVLLLAGHSHGCDLPIRTMRGVVARCDLGRLRMIHTWCFSDGMYRRRRRDERDPERGGGVIYRQGAHPFDISRSRAGCSSACALPHSTVIRATIDHRSARNRCAQGSYGFTPLCIAGR